MTKAQELIARRAKQMTMKVADAYYDRPGTDTGYTCVMEDGSLFCPAATQHLYEPSDVVGMTGQEVRDFHSRIVREAVAKARA